LNEVNNKYLALNDIESYKIRFYQYSRGSIKECFDWNEKSRVRKLISQEDYNYIFGELNKLPKAINSLIKYTREKLIV